MIVDVKVDFRNIKTQKDIEYLFSKTNFIDGILLLRVYM